MNWVDSVLASTEQVETPKSFLQWSLFSAIAAVASPNVSLNKQGAYNLHPNIYVMLLADSGLGKGFGPWLAKSLVKQVDNTRVFTGRNSIQKIVTDLSVAYTRKGKEMIKDARAFIATGEFINLLIKDDQGISIITEWYDTHYVKEWPNSLKSTGVEILRDVNITVLGASNDEFLRESVPVAAIKGGFFGRFMFIHAKEKSHFNDLLDEPTEDQQISKKIPEFAKHLIEISKIQTGSQFKITEEARKFYRPWYYDLQERIKNGQASDKTGYIHRLHDHALKISMVLSLSESLDLLLKRSHVEEGISLCEALLQNLKKTTLGIGLSVAAPKNEVFLKALFKTPEGRMLRRRMLQNYGNDFSSQELDSVALTMEDAGFIKQQGNGKEQEFLLTSLGKKHFLERVVKK